MDKIKYYNNPLDEKAYIEVEKYETIGGTLDGAGLNGKPLCIVINDEILDDVDLDYEIKDDDKIEIVEFVEGNNETWATIVEVAAVAVGLAIIIGSGGSGTALGLGVMSAGSALANHLRSNVTPDTPDSPETVAVALNQSAPSSATNTSRALQVIPVPMGSIRMAPDAYTSPFISRPLKWMPEPPGNWPTGYDSINYNWRLAKTPEYEHLWRDEYKRMMSHELYSFSSQSFCFGFGDMEISGRRVGNVDVEVNLDVNGYDIFRRIHFGHSDTFGFSSMNDYQPPSNQYGREYDVSNPFLADDVIVTPITPTDIKVVKNAELTNSEWPTGFTSTDDESSMNWIYFEGGVSLDIFQFSITGSLYSNSGGQISYNTTVIEMQYRMKGEITWTAPSPRSYILENNSMSPVYTTFIIEIGSSFDHTGGEYQVRIRKMYRDSTDNVSGELSRVARLSITDARFYTSRTMSARREEIGQSKFPMNIEGIWVGNNLNAEGSGTGNYSAVVESKCYVFENDEWVWKHSRNPAWWFLYFARGGFYALESRDDDPQNVFPFSPTNYWQNYAGHQYNSELIFGCGYTHNKIDMDKIIEWAQFCDNQGLTIDFVLRSDGSAAETLEDIASAGRGSVTYDSGKLSVLYEDKNQIPVTVFGMGNMIAGSFSAGYSFKSETSKIRAKFSNRFNNFETEDVEASVPFDQSDQKIVQEIVFDKITDPGLAQREVNLLAAREYFQRRKYSWKSDHEGFLARRGDLVYLSHDSTQFGYSGRVVEFILDDDEIIGMKGSSRVDRNANWVLVKLPNADLIKLRCHVDDGAIYFDDEFPAQNGPSHIRDQKRFQENLLSRFPDTTPDDFTYLADIKEVTGKTVRIISVETDENHNFSYVAVDEDAAMWAYENNIIVSTESQDDSIAVLEVYDATPIYKGNGVVEILFNADDDCLFIFVNKQTGLPIDINGRFSTSEKKVTLELDEGVPFSLEIRPLPATQSFFGYVQVRGLEVELWQA